MREFFSQGLFVIVIQTITGLSVFSLFLAIFIDFALYSGEKTVEKEKKSIVETGTMTLFFFVFCLILKGGLGVVQVESVYIKKLLMILGTVIIVLAAIANISGRLSLGKNWANQIKIYSEHTLVKTGMYKIVRHPLYSSIILMFYGACMEYRSFAAFLAVSFIFVPFMYYRARQEEKLLIQSFPSYKEYRQSTGMLFPKLFKRKGV